MDVLGVRRDEVLHVITDTNRRGAQVFACDLASCLQERDRPGTVVAMKRGGSGSQLSVPVLINDHRRGAMLHALRQCIRTSGVVIAHGSDTLRACVLAGAGLSTPVIYRNISDPNFWMSTTTRKLRVRLMLSQVEHVVALWSGGALFLQHELGLSRDKVSVIPNGVRPTRYRFPDGAERINARKRFGLPPEGTVVLFAAALQPEKHPETAVRALSLLPPDTRLLIVGDGPRRSEVMRLAERTAPNRVVVAGQIEDMRIAYWASDVIVLPSEGEGLPAVLIEAALSGVPAVASTSGGNSDIVQDGVCGRLVPPADHSQLAQRLTEVTANRVRMGRAAAEHCSAAFDMRNIVDAWKSVLSRMQQYEAVRNRR